MNKEQIVNQLQEIVASKEEELNKYKNVWLRLMIMTEEEINEEQQTILSLIKEANNA